MASPGWQQDFVQFLAVTTVPCPGAIESFQIIAKASTGTSLACHSELLLEQSLEDALWSEPSVALGQQAA